MRLHHLIGGLIMGVAAVGLGAAIASPVLTLAGRPIEASGASQIAILFLFPTLLPSALLLRAAVRDAQTRRLSADVDAHAGYLLQRFAALTGPNAKAGVNMRGWNDEVWRFRNALPRRYPLVSQALAAKIVTDRVIELADALGAKRNEAAQPALAARVERELSSTGWRVKQIFGQGGERHVLAEKSAIRVLTLCCAHTVSNADVERAVECRTRLGADLAAIVAANGCTSASRTLARATRVGLVADTHVKEITRAAGRLWRARKAASMRPGPAAPAPQRG
ncbi:MAG: hypothetical protein AB7J28_03020 [Hyphomonadaceae bacterium]